MAHAIIKDHVGFLGGQVVGEQYISLGSTDVEQAVEEIVRTKPDVILNTINGDTNVAFFKLLREKGIMPSKTPTMSFSIGEPELAHLDFKNMVGDYAAWNYFQSIQTDTNRKFVELFHEKYGKKRVIGDAMEAAYFGVYLWKNAVEKGGKFDSKSVMSTSKGISLSAPEGPVYLDEVNHHTWKIARVGKIESNGQFSIVWHSGRTVQPKPYPYSREKKEWKLLLARISNNSVIKKKDDSTPLQENKSGDFVESIEKEEIRHKKPETIDQNREDEDSKDPIDQDLEDEDSEDSLETEDEL